MTTTRRATDDLIGGFLGLERTWHWYIPSSSMLAAVILKFQSLAASSPTISSLGKPGSDLVWPRPNWSLEQVSK